MELRLFILLFITGIVPLVLSVPRKYYLIQQGRTWTDARAYCQATHTDMAIVESTDDLIRLQNEIQRQKFSSSAWLGLYNDVNSWRWSYGDEPLGSMRLWDSGQPNNGAGIEACIAMYAGLWSDWPCKTGLYFVCFDNTKTGNQRYIFLAISKTWYDAQIYCRTYYTDLASARDSTENSILQQLGTINSFWIGLFRDSWKWTDQTNFSSIGWMAISPNNAFGNENCGYLNNGQVNDAQCSNMKSFFCYSPITNIKQTVKLKVQSSQDANDPAVKAAILAQIEQKLKDHGLAENITVKWREQPEGNVFYKEKDKVEL